MKNSLKDQLKKLIENRGGVSFGEVANFTMEEGYRVSNMERRMRELCAEGYAYAIMDVSRRKTSYIKGWTSRKPPEPQKPRIILEGEKAILIYPKQKEYEQRKLY